MATIQKRKKKDGKCTYTATIRIKGYDPVTATFDRISDAKDWVQEIEPQMKKGKHIKEIEAKKHTMAELIDRYIAYDLPRRDSDHVRFKSQLNWWKDKIGTRLLSNVTPALLSECKSKLLNEPYKVKILDNGTKTEHRFSSATANRYMAALSIVLTKAAKEYCWIESNPMFDVSKEKEPRGRIRYLSDEERIALIKACQEASNPLIYLLVVLALSTGGRFSEIINLKWGDVDLKRKILCFMDTKNGENRAVPISALAHDLLSKRLSSLKIRHLNSDFVFARPDGKKPLDLRHQWETVLKNSKIKNFHFHDLRHTAASYLAMNGATLVEISEILGHKTMQMVKRYSHLTTKHTAEVLERMNEKQFALPEEKAL